MTKLLLLRTSRIRKTGNSLWFNMISHGNNKGKSKVTVKFPAHQNNMAGPVFGIRTVKK